MRLYFYGFIAIIKKFIFRKNTGEVIRQFASKMGVVYIKFAQMLAMQNYGNIFTEEDRICLSKICDNCNPIKFKKIMKILKKEYGCSLANKFQKIYEEPVGSASISQVHKAILKNGQVVAIKIKRNDITKKIEKDIKRLNKLIHRFGKFTKFKNFLGGETALNLYLEWINTEIDFINEKNNILRYHAFSKSVNAKLPDTVRIVTPRVYKKLCTENIIVMEFIPFKTINQMKLTTKNKEAIKKCLNDYIRLSFYALFNNLPVVFHGDPHGGNIYVDKYGNVGFLDMGLIFEFTLDESKMIKKLFFNAYNKNYEDLTMLLLENSTYKEVNVELLKIDIKKCCEKFKTIPVTEFFIEMINIFTRYNVSPPAVLFKMAKAFVSLYGINNFIDNKVDTEELLLPQIIEYYVNRSINDLKEVFETGTKIIPNFISKTINEGLSKSISEEIVAISDLNKKITETINNYQEIKAFFDSTSN